MRGVNHPAAFKISLYKRTQEPRPAIRCLEMGSRNRNSGAALCPFLVFFLHLQKTTKALGGLPVYFFLPSQFTDRTCPETRPPARDKNGTPTSVALATINSSSSCHRHTKQTRRQGLRRADKPVCPSSYPRRGRKAEREAKKKKEKKRFSYHKP